MGLICNSCLPDKYYDIVTTNSDKFVLHKGCTYCYSDKVLSIKESDILNELQVLKSQNK